MQKEWKLVTIDPSLRNLGFTIFTMLNNGIRTVDWLGDISLTPPIPKETTWIQIASSMANATYKLLYNHVGHIPVAFIVETQENWAGPKGIHSKDTGAIQKLYFFTGILSHKLTRITTPLGVWGVGPTHWKGQTPKKIMIRRAKAFCAELNINHAKFSDHAAEALLLGRYAIGHMLWSETILKFKKPIELLQLPEFKNLTYTLTDYLV
jgi:hypothetical protein